MRRTLLLGTLLFLGFAVAFAPAGLIRAIFDQIDGLTLIHPAGTIWHGQGHIMVRETDLGRLKWDIRPAAMLAATLAYDFTLASTPMDTTTRRQLSGSAKISVNRSIVVQLSGSVSAGLINRYLAPYDIMISGDLLLNQAGLTLHGGVPHSASGEITWSGGTVRYILSGRSASSILPPLVAYLGDGPQAVVFTQNGQTPLIKAELLDNGFAKIGITKLFTKILDSPWPGSDPDHAVVLEVEEQVF